MTNQLVVVFTTNGGGQAAIIQELLASAGIPAQTSQEGAGAVYGLTVGPLGQVDILVPERYAAAAEQLLAAMQRGDLEEGAGPSARADDSGDRPAGDSSAA
ncbi:MAG: DUF2007 domain-containing protein [Anaerolineales bacterium]|nr:DUF2007 domain-containing protein [Anaerolineales bacterium]